MVANATKIIGRSEYFAQLLRLYVIANYRHRRQKTGPELSMWREGLFFGTWKLPDGVKDNLSLIWKFPDGGNIVFCGAWKFPDTVKLLICGVWKFPDTAKEHKTPAWKFPCTGTFILYVIRKFSKGEKIRLCLLGFFRLFFFLGVKLRVKFFGK
jgi:hypothetical protein